MNSIFIPEFFVRLVLAILTVGMALGCYSLIRWFRRKRLINQPSGADSSEQSVTIQKILLAISYSYIIYSIIGIHNVLEIREILLRWGGLLVIANVDLFKSVVPFELVFITFFSRFFLSDFKMNYLDSVLGLLLIFVTIFLINKLIQRFKKRSAIGFGDLMVCSLIGWFFGVVSGFRGVALGLVLAGIYALFFRIKGKPGTTTYPMALFLIWGTAIATNL
jgi:prepilin signal peptidase PulO-like enzyme (type II secretory pathway)